MSDHRIEQFQKMTESDPDNELGHFSLGKALMAAGRHEQAAASFRRVIELSREFSKAYALLGQCLVELDRRDEAVGILREGFDLARERGDLMPRNEMGVLLRKLGVEPPAGSHAPTARKAAQASASGFACRRCGGPSQLAGLPMSGELGQRIFEQICTDCWHEWIGMGTKVINELRLELRSEESQRVYDEHMCEFLGLDG